MNRCGIRFHSQDAQGSFKFDVYSNLQVNDRENHDFSIFASLLAFFKYEKTF